MSGFQKQSVMEKLREMIPEEVLSELEPTGPAAVYTALATVWLMVWQRLGGGMSMQAVIKDALEHPEIFPDCKRVREGTLSTRDTAFCDARQRIRKETIVRLLEAVSSSLIDACTVPGERRVFIVDGTTLTTAPTADLKAAFPPVINQHGEAVWPTVQMLVAHELNSGCALLPELGAKYGSNCTSEAAMLRQMCQRLPADSIVLADAGFGIFGPAWDCIQAGLSIAFRLSASQYGALIKKGKPLHEVGAGESHSVCWQPTKRNLNTNPHITSDAELEVVIHTIPFSEVLPGCATTKLLHLVTTPDITRAAAIALYLKRYSVEHDIRDVKVTLNTERIRAHSRSMFEKELLTSLIAYNLVVQFRREAAIKANVPPRRLSFTGVWNTFQSFFLKLSPAVTIEQWQDRYERALKIASKEIIRHRPGRSFPRQAHTRRQKTTKSAKSKTKQKIPIPN